MGAHQSLHEDMREEGGDAPSLPAPDFNRNAPDFSNFSRAGGFDGAPKTKQSLASKAMNPRNTIRKSLRKRKEKRIAKGEDEEVRGYEGRAQIICHRTVRRKKNVNFS